MTFKWKSKVILLIIQGFLVHLTASTPTPISCSGEICYWYDDTPQTDSSGGCKDVQKSKLVSITDASIQQELETFLSGNSGISSAWIGLKHTVTSDWGWNTGTTVAPLTYSIFPGVENALGKCGAMASDSSSMWMISNCTSQKAFICMKATPCPAQTQNIVKTFPSGQSCYFWISNEKTWFESIESCSSFGGQLATFPQKGSWDDVKQQISSSSNKLYWIALSKISQEWASGASVVYSKWASGQSVSDTSSACTTISSDGGWHTRECVPTSGSSYPSFCETTEVLQIPTVAPPPEPPQTSPKPEPKTDTPTVKPEPQTVAPTIQPESNTDSPTVKPEPQTDSPSESITDSQTVQPEMQTDSPSVQPELISESSQTESTGQMVTDSTPSLSPQSTAFLDGNQTEGNQTDDQTTQSSNVTTSTEAPVRAVAASGASLTNLGIAFLAMAIVVPLLHILILYLCLRNRKKKKVPTATLR